MAKWIRLTTGLKPEPVFVNMDRAGLVQGLPESGAIIKFNDSFHLAVHETPEQVLQLCNNVLHNDIKIGSEPHEQNVLRPQ